MLCHLVNTPVVLDLSYSKGMVSKMLKFQNLNTGRLLGVMLASTVCLPLAGCMGFDSLLDEGPAAYTADEMYPIAARKPCGQNIPDLAYDPTNHLAPNHGCAVHANIAAMVADPSVLKKPKRKGPAAASTAVMAISNYEANAQASTKTSNGTTYTVTQSP
jgi:Pilus biogenesis CpaD protein (pilus_cpaD)